MKVVVVEDEHFAVEALKRQLHQLDVSIEVMAELDTVEDAVDYFKQHTLPDLVFMDIQLADGVSFEIFQHVELNCPIIFTTAYDAYALQAFSVHAIDYLLKPISLEGLERALAKYNRSQTPGESITISPEVIAQLLQANKQSYKDRFMIKIGERLQSIPSTDILFFQGEHKSVWLYHSNGRKYIVDYTLEQLESMLDPMRFFRLNRSYIATLEAISEVVQYSNSRLKVTIKAGGGHEAIISRNKAEPFRVWLGK